MGKEIWSITQPLFLVETKGQKLPVGTTKVYIAKDKKYQGKKKYHVYQKTAEKGKKAWKYIGTVGAAKADAHLKNLGIDVEDGAPVGFSPNKGKSMMIPPKDDDFVPGAGSVGPKVNIQSAGVPEDFVSHKDQSKHNYLMKDIIQLRKDWMKSGHQPEAIDDLKEKYSNMIKATGGSVTGLISFSHELNASIVDLGLSGKSSEEIYKAWLEQWHLGKSNKEMKDLYGDNWSAVAWGMATAFSKHQGGVGDPSDKGWENTPEFKKTLPEPKESVTSVQQSKFNFRMKNLAGFLGAMKAELQSVGTPNIQKVGGDYDLITSAFWNAGGSLGAYSFASGIKDAADEVDVLLDLPDAHTIYNKWLEKHANKTLQQMKTLGGDDWSAAAWGMAAAISKMLGGPGDPDTPEWKPEVGEPVPAEYKPAGSVPPLTTASSFKVIPSGKGKAVPVGTTKIQPAKDKLQVHKKTADGWDYIGVVGAKKGKKKGNAEAHLKTLGIETDGTKITNLDVGGSAVAVMPAEEQPKQPDQTDPSIPVPDKLLDPSFLPAATTPEGLAKLAAYEKKLSGLLDALPEFKKAGMSLWTIPVATKAKWAKQFDMKGQGGHWVDLLSLAAEVDTVASDAYDPSLSDEENITNFIVGAVPSLGDAEMFGPDWGYKIHAIAKLALAKQKQVDDAMASIGYAPKASLALKKKKYPPVSDAVKAKLQGFGELYKIVKDAGGPSKVSPTAAAIFDKHNPGWQGFYKTADSLASSGIEAVLPLPKGSGIYGQEVVEIHKHVFGSYPGEADEPEKKKFVDLYPAGATAPTPTPAQEPKKPKKKYTPPPVVAPPVSAPEKPGFTPGSKDTPAADLPIPPPSGLTLKKGATSGMGGAGAKEIYTDTNGNEFLFKLATSKTSGKAQPFRAYVQAGFSEIAKKIKPIHPKIEVTKLGGTVGAIYPFLPGAPKLDLAGQSPSTLSPQEKQDVAEEHVIDWLMSQHDSHSKNFLRTEDGRIIGIDKEQGFKYFGSDELSTDYHPNSVYGEQEPFYNKFWREFAEGKNDFDPMKMKGAIQKAASISNTEFTASLRPYVEQVYPGNKASQEIFLQRAVNRKNTLRRDFEKFITTGYRKRTGEEGSFTFDSGWISSKDEDKPTKKTVHHPAVIETAESEFGAIDSVGSGTNAKGFKAVSFKAKDGNIDPSKVTIKSSGTAEELEAKLKGLGFTGFSVKSGSSYRIAIVNKNQFDSAKNEIAAWDEEVIIPPKSKTIAPHSGQPTYFPAVGLHEETTGNVDKLKTINKDTKLRWQGERLTLGGSAVEQQVARISKKKDENGVYFEVHFKLRADQIAKMKGGTASLFQFRTGKWDEKQGLQVDSKESTRTIAGKKWETENGEIFLSTHKNQWAFRGGVYAKIRSDDVEGEIIKLLDSMKKGLAKEVLRDPTESERKTMIYSSALKDVSPQEADELDELESKGKFERTEEEMLERVSKHLTQEEVSSLTQQESLPNFASTTSVGRWKTLGGGTPEDPVVRFLMWEVSTPQKVVNMFKGNGPASIHDRGLQGLPISEDYGASVGSDVRTGGADNITMRLITKGEMGHQAAMGWGDIRLIFSPDQIDRTDTLFHFGDEYGCTNPNDSKHGGAYKARDSIEKNVKKIHSTGAKGELVIRRGVSPDKIVRISCEGEDTRKKMIEAFKSAGIDEIQGCPVEDFVVVASTRGEIWEKYVKPAVA